MNSSTRHVCFLGRGSKCLPHVLSSETQFITPLFIDLDKIVDSRTALSSIESFRPDYLVILDPRVIPMEIVERVQCFKIAFMKHGVTELISLTHTSHAHPLMQPDTAIFDAVQTEYQEALIIEKESNDSINLNAFDIVVSSTSDPKESDFGSKRWRSIPTPIDDKFFTGLKSVQFPPRFGYIKSKTLYSTPYRACLDAIPEVDEIAIDYTDKTLSHDLKFDVFINLKQYPCEFLNERVPLHLAAGGLVISEPLYPTHGLEPNVDFLEITNPIDLCMILEELRNFPDAAERIRISGRRKAEYFRASNVYEKLIYEIEEVG